jgi:predicted TIM-barrel fold metal-dependent hydrolase
MNCNSMSTSSRRAFLLSTGAGLLPAAPARQIVDTHIHIYDSTRPQGVPWPPKTDALLYKPTLPATYEALVKPLGVTGTIVVEASAWVEDNQWVLDQAKDHPMILGVVGHLDPTAQDFRTQLARFSKNRLFKGIRLNANQIVKLSPDALRPLGDAGLMLDAIGNASMIPALAKVPNLRIAIDHMPAEPPGWPDHRAELRDLAQRPNVYAKVSGVVGTPRELLDEVFAMFGPGRVMYGSNWPVSNRRAPYAEVLKTMHDYLSTKPAPQAEQFFWRNAKDCYRW